MTGINEATGGFLQVSSLAGDVWHGDAGPGAYEWWYFDAVSDDGRDALVCIFLADFVFSPRFNRLAARHEAARRGANHGRGDKSGGPAVARAARFPAVAVSLYRDGRPVWRAVNEYAAEEFHASTERPECRIGGSSFRLEDGPRGPLFRLSLDETLRRGRRLHASLVWELEDGGVAAGSAKSEGGAASPFEGAGAHEWNLVAPRCRVEGSLFVVGRGGARFAQHHFQGTGYHDHNRDSRWLPATVAEWSWGRAHFDDATAVFYSYHERGASEPVTRLFIARGGALASHAARLVPARTRRHVFGLRYPRELRVEAEGAGASLVVRQRKVVDGSYFYLRFAGEAALDTGGGPAQTAPALSELLAPRALRWRWLDWLTDMRVGRDGRASFLK